MPARATSAMATLPSQNLGAAWTLAGLFAVGLLVGCAGGVTRQDAAQVAMAAGHIGPDGRAKSLAWSLNSGSTLVYAKNAPRAILVLGGAEELMKGRDLSNFGDTNTSTRPTTA